tara:strand:- start:51079 stop:51975 length:897 start_codon:yes stop_codon:yes gene_type:complete
MNHLRAFYICALQKNITKTAEVLRVSQPSISQQLKLFEQELGFPVFFRNGRTLDLTSEGKLLFQKSKSVFESIIGVEDFLECKTGFSGKISLLASDDIERPFLAKISNELMKSASFYRAAFSVNSIAGLAKSNLHKTKSDEFYLSNGKMKSLELVHEFSFPVKLISTVQNIEMGQVKTSNLRSLLSRLGQRLLVPSKGHALRTELEDHVDISELKEHILLESNVMTCLTHSVREGLGCSLLPIQYVYDDVKKNNLSVFGPPNGFWEHRLFLYSSKNQSHNVAKELVRIIQKFSIEKGG